MTTKPHICTFSSALVVALAGPILIAGLAGCSDDSGLQRITHRWIEADPHLVFNPDDLGELSTVDHWVFNAGKELRRWEIRDAEARPHRDGSLSLTITGDELSLERDIDPGQAPIHAVRVAVFGLKGGEASLSWADHGQNFASGRSLTLPWTREGDAPHVFVFDVAQHPLWTGRPARIRLQLQPDDRPRVRIAWIETARRDTEPEAIDGAIDAAWKIDFDGEVRTARLGHPDRPIEQIVDIGAKGAKLRFSIGLQPGVDEPTTFTVAEVGDDGPPLFTRRLEPAKTDRSRWVDAEVPLDAFSGRQVRLRLTVETEGALDVFQGLPAWGSPEVVDLVDEIAQPNIVVVCLDTLRADRLSAYGYHRTTSPEIDAWARENSVLFRHVVAPAPWTLPSHVSIFSGTEAISHGINHRGPAPAELEMMAETLRSAGYTTAAITGGGILRPKYGFSQGFDTFAYWPKKSRPKELAWGHDRAESWIEEHRGEPFFLFFHTYEIHYPFLRREPFFSRLTEDIDPPLPRGAVRMKKHGWQGLRYPGDYLQFKSPGSDDWRDPLTGIEKELVNAMYDSGVANADATFGELLALIKGLDPHRPTLIVVTSDHGEALGEEDRAGHSYLEDYNAMVPLIIEFPDGRGAGMVVQQQVRLIDLLPTMLSYLELDADHVPHGRSLLPLVAGDESNHPREAWTYSSSNNRGLALRLDNRVKYTFNNTAWSEVANEESLIDLADDPGEETNLAPGDARTGELRDRTQREVDAGHSGYRLTIRNTGPGLLAGALGGSWAEVSRIKTAGQDCLHLEWLGDDDAVFEAEGGCEAVLYFEGLTGPEVEVSATLRVRGRGEIAFAEALDLDQLDAPMSMVFDGTSWQRGDQAKDDGSTGITIWWHGPRPVFDESSPRVNSTLIDQLKALGYVE